MGVSPFHLHAKIFACQTNQSIKILRTTLPWSSSSSVAAAAAAAAAAASMLQERSNVAKSH